MFYEQRMQREDARAQLPIPRDALVLLFFGIVREYKGLEDLIDALPLVLERYPNVQLLIAGEFWDDVDDYQAQIRRLGLEGMVTIDNRYIPNEEVIRYFSAADVLVAPYRRVTGSGVVQLALGMRCPVITTRVGESMNLVLEGSKGRTVSPNNPKALANAILDYLGRDLAVTKDCVQKWGDGSWDRLLDAVEDSVPNRQRDS